MSNSGAALPLPLLTHLDLGPGWVLRLLQRFLKQQGGEVVTATNGQIALDKYLAAPDSFHMILMDCQMPVMDGYEAARAIRRWEREREAAEGGGQRHIHIVACTAGAHATEVEGCYESGMCEVILKPINQPTLVSVVASGLRSFYARCSHSE